MITHFNRTDNVNDEMLQQILAGRKALGEPSSGNDKKLDDATNQLLDTLRGLKKLEYGPIIWVIL